MTAGGFRWWHEAGLAVVLLAVLGWAGATEAEFLSLRTQLALSSHVWELALLALPMMLIVVTAGIDLSVGATMALSAVVLGLTYEMGLSPWVGAMLGLMVGLAAGALNGLFVAYVGVHPLIVTLATMAAYRGTAEGISLARPISGFPESFQFLGRGDLLGIPLPGVIFVTLAAVSAVLLTQTRFGLSLYAIGSNETAARLSGIRVARTKLLLYSCSGSVAGLTAAIYVSRRNTAKADIATGLELDVITAVVLGGTSIFGGRGSVVGTLLGIAVIHEVRELVSWRWNNDELVLVVVGVLLILSVLLNRLVGRSDA